MSNIQGLGNTPHINRPKLESPVMRQVSDAATTNTASGTDRLELSSTGPIDQPSTAREARLAEIKQQIKDGTYNEDAKLDAVLDKVLDELA